MIGAEEATRRKSDVQTERRAAIGAWVEPFIDECSSFLQREVAIWRFDAALVAQIAAVLKQAAIEEGQWSEKREMSGSVPLEVAKAIPNSGGTGWRPRRRRRWLRASRGRL